MPDLEPDRTLVTLRTADADLRKARLTAQLLAGTKPREPVAVVERILAIQGQDPRGARLAIRARSNQLTAADVDRALTDDRSLVISWLNRGTLHLVRSEDYGWLHSLTAPPLMTGNARRLQQEGLSPSAADKGVRVIVRALDADGPMTREELAQRLRSAGVLVEGQGLVHLLFLATIRGRIVRGPMKGRRQAFVLVDDWLGPQPSVDRTAALRELALRYLAGHGPADERDLAKWSGLPLRDARSAMHAAASALVIRPDGLAHLARHPRSAPLPPPRLLGSFDPVLHGWASRALITGEHDAAIISGGVFRPSILIGGSVVGSWALDGRRIRLEAATDLTKAARLALDADAKDVVRFLARA